MRFRKGMETPEPLIHTHSVEKALRAINKVSVDGKLFSTTLAYYDYPGRGIGELGKDVEKERESLIPGASSVRHAPTQYLLRKDIEVKGDLDVIYPDVKGRHVRNNDLSWPVHRLPGRKDQVWILVSDLARSCFFFVLLGSGEKGHSESGEKGHFLVG